MERGATSRLWVARGVDPSCGAPKQHLFLADKASAPFVPYELALHYKQPAPFLPCCRPRDSRTAGTSVPGILLLCGAASPGLDQEGIRPRSAASGHQDGPRQGGAHHPTVALREGAAGCSTGLAVCRLSRMAAASPHWRLQQTLLGPPRGVPYSTASKSAQQAASTVKYNRLRL
jgi:hypothetical protein